jgi:hypothetical protein
MEVRSFVVQGLAVLEHGIKHDAEYANEDHQANPQNQGVLIIYLPGYDRLRLRQIQLVRVRRRHSQPGIQRDRHHPHYACCCFTAHIFPHLISDHPFHALVIQDNQIFLSRMESYDLPGCETLINVNFRAVSKETAVDLPGPLRHWLATTGS